MKHENNGAWRLYIVPDIRSWAENKNKTPIEYYDTFEQAKARFNELRSKPYNSKSVSALDGAPAARLTIGIDNGKTHAAADIIHVRGGENVLSEDFLHSREITDDNSAISLIEQISGEIGVDKVLVRPVSENGRYGNPVLVPFDKWAEEHDFPSRDISHKTNADLSAIRGERETAMDMPLISVSKERGTNNPFDVTSVGLETDRKYTVAEFNEVIKKSNEIWRNSWDGSGDPQNIAIVTIDNLHKAPCTYRINLADEYNSIQDIVSSNPFPPYLNPRDAVEEPVEVLNKAETMSQNNADLSAAQRDKEYIMDTKLECTSMVMLAEGSKAKAVATVTVNDEFVLKGIKVYDGANGLFVSMPSRKFGSEYSDVVFPITKEAREQLNSTVLGSYGKLLESGLDKLQTEKREPPEQSASKISVSLHRTDNDRTKAVGQIVIDDCIVISGVKVNHGTNAAGIEKDFVGMPSYQTQTGEYNEYAHPITKECYDKVQSAVLKAYETLQKTEYKGIKLSDLGEKGGVSSRYGLNNQFAERLMAELDRKGIPYSAKVTETTSLSVKSENKAALSNLEKELSTALKNAQQPKQEQKPVHTKPKSR